MRGLCVQECKHLCTCECVCVSVHKGKQSDTFDWKHGILQHMHMQSRTNNHTPPNTHTHTHTHQNTNGPLSFHCFSAAASVQISPLVTQHYQTHCASLQRAIYLLPPSPLFPLLSFPFCLFISVSARLPPPSPSALSRGFCCPFLFFGLHVSILDFHFSGILPPGFTFSFPAPPGDHLFPRAISATLSSAPLSY